MSARLVKSSRGTPIDVDGPRKQKPWRHSTEVVLTTVLLITELSLFILCTAENYIGHFSRRNTQYLSTSC